MISDSFHDDRAVSPVIGVILMVAITVILAAVIGAFVLGLGDSVESEVRAGVSITDDSESATVTWSSEGDASVLSVRATVVDVDTSNTGTFNLNVGETESSTYNQDGDAVSGEDDPVIETLGSVAASLDVSAEDIDLNDNDAVVDIRITIVGQDGDRETVIQQETVTLEILSP